jgi:hypothetical protein
MLQSANTFPTDLILSSQSMASEEENTSIKVRISEISLTHQ